MVDVGTGITLLDRLLGRRVDPSEARIVAFYPRLGPHKGATVLIDGERHRISYVRLSWDGPRWTVRSLRVRRLA